MNIPTVHTYNCILRIITNYRVDWVVSAVEFLINFNLNVNWILLTTTSKVFSNLIPISHPNRKKKLDFQLIGSSHDLYHLLMISFQRRLSKNYVTKTINYGLVLDFLHNIYKETLEFTGILEVWGFIGTQRMGLLLDNFAIYSR